MKPYELIELSLYKERIIVNSTEPDVLTWIYDDLITVMPNCKTSSEKLPSGKQFSLTIEKIDTREGGWVILSKLCSIGWQPFSVVKAETSNIYVEHKTVYLRLEGYEM
jgi:hypothetical protein